MVDSAVEEEIEMTFEQRKHMESLRDQLDTPMPSYRTYRFWIGHNSDSEIFSFDVEAQSCVAAWPCLSPNEFVSYWEML